MSLLEKRKNPSIEVEYERIEECEVGSVGNVMKKKLKVEPSIKIVHPTNAELIATMKMASLAFDPKILDQNTLLPKAVTYNKLISHRYPLIDGNLYLMKSTTNYNIIKNFLLAPETFEDQSPIFIRGPSGVGKSYSLIHLVLEFKKSQRDHF